MPSNWFKWEIAHRVEKNIRVCVFFLFTSPIIFFLISIKLVFVLCLHYSRRSDSNERAMLLLSIMQCEKNIYMVKGAGRELGEKIATQHSEL